MTDAPSPPGNDTGWQTARIAQIKTRTARIKSFYLQPTTPFRHRAGQHVDLRLTAPDGYQAVRSYSIATASEESGVVEVAIERLGDGEVSPFFHDVAAVHDEIELRGPLGGHFIWSPGEGGPLLLIGGGSGVVPLLAMIRQREKQMADVPIVLLLSTRSMAEAPFLDELIAIEARSNGFWLRLALTREPPRREGDYGRRLDAAMIGEALGLLPEAPRRVFICGSNAFVNTAADGALTVGVPAGVVRTERYGG